MDQEIWLRPTSLYTHTRASSFCVRILQETKMKSKKSKHVDHDKTCRDR